MIINYLKQLIINRPILDSASSLTFLSISDFSKIHFSYARGGGAIELNDNPVNLNGKVNYFSKYMFGVWGDPGLQINKSGRLLKPVISGIPEPWIKENFAQVYRDIQQGEIIFEVEYAALFDFAASGYDSTLIDENSIDFQVIGNDMVRLRFTSLAGEAGLTKITITISPKSASLEDELATKIQIYPNPFQESLYLKNYGKYYRDFSRQFI